MLVAIKIIKLIEHNQTMAEWLVVDESLVGPAVPFIRQRTDVVSVSISKPFEMESGDE